MIAGLGWSALGRVAAALLSVVFVVAAGSKLLDLHRVTEEFVALGIRRANVAARVVPALEFGTAVLLWVVPWLGGSVSVAMLCGFTVVLLRQLRSGAPASCACFGSTSARPVTGRDLVRNLVLISLSLVAVAGG